jgi:hypothetical protein
MKETLLLSIFAVFFVITGCKKITPDNSCLQIITKESGLKKINLNQDIDKLTLQELRLLRSYPYAKQGFIFKDAEIDTYFKSCTDWYIPLIDKLQKNSKQQLYYSAVILQDEEKALEKKIDKRIAQLKKSNFRRNGNFRTANIDNLVNLFQFNGLDSLFMEKLRENNFVITQENDKQLFHVYEENNLRQIPHFITTDLYLQLLHVYFSYILKSLEQQKFIPTLNQLCLRLYNEAMLIAETETRSNLIAIAEYNAAFYAIPYYLLTGKKLVIPESYEKSFAAEIFNINNQEDTTSAFLSFTEAKFPYSLFKADGRYAGNLKMDAYYKAMMWLQTAPFCRSDRDQLQQAIFSAVLLNRNRTKGKESLRALYQTIYDPVEFLIGAPDNLSIKDIADCLQKEKITDLQKALKPENLTKINKLLAKLSETRHAIKPQIEKSCPNKIKFMPQRYLIDNDIIQSLVDIRSNSQRTYPKGLDIFAALGSPLALNLLTQVYKEPELWNEYSNEMSKKQAKFLNYKKWDSSIYNQWLKNLLELQKNDKNYPGFMQTQAWNYKNLNTSLASWAELKHDAILYDESPMTVINKKENPVSSTIKGYVEPNLNFWNQLTETISLTKNLLMKHKLLTPDLEIKTNQFLNYSKFMTLITKKELAFQELTDNEYRAIQDLGNQIKDFTLSLIDPGRYLSDWSLVKGPDQSIANVTDIYTRNVSNCEKSGVMHVATGNADHIYVVTEMKGFLYLTRGAIFSYYEFVQPLGIRLSDKNWQKMIEDKNTPSIPVWMEPIIIKKQ